jgi:hypothetical protein
VRARTGAALAIGLALGAALAAGESAPADVSRTSCRAVSLPPNALPRADRPPIHLDRDAARRTVVSGGALVLGAIHGYDCTPRHDR